MIVEGDQHHDRPDGLERRGADGLQRAVRGLAAGRRVLRDPHAPARRGHVPDEHVPQNDGIFRRVKVIAPKGTIFNPNFPRACFSRFCQVQRVVDNTILALVRGRARAGDGRQLGGICTSAPTPGSSPETGEYWLYLEVNEGSYGGRYGKDGMDSVDNLMANTRNNPIEELDMRFPMRCERYELRDGAGGARAVARRHRHRPPQPLPRRRHVLVRGRPAVRPAARHLRRLGRARRPRCRKNPGTTARRRTSRRR